MLKPAFSSGKEVGSILAALGLFLIGLAFFFGSILWLAGQKHCSNQDTK